MLVTFGDGHAGQGGKTVTVKRVDSMLVTGRPLFVPGMGTSPPDRCKPVMVSVPLLVVKVNWPGARRAIQQQQKRQGGGGRRVWRNVGFGFRGRPSKLFF